MSNENKITAGSVAKSAGKGFLKFIVGLICYLIAIAINVMVVLVAIGTWDGDAALIIGIAASIIFALLIFIIPFLRHMKSVKWLAWLALGDAAWWIYLLVSGGLF